MQRISYCFFIAFIVVCSVASIDALTPLEMYQYRALCKKANQDQKTYEKLREHPLHCKVVEPFSESNQKGYCLQIDRQAFLPHVIYSKLTKWDQTIKGPQCRLSLFFSLSPLALRHGQIAIELEKEFGPLESLHILQIGGGFGHLAAHLAETTGFASLTLLDFPEPLSIQKKFLSSCGISNVHMIEPEQIGQNQYDLVLCVFPFTEWGNKKQRKALLEHIKHIPKGYITCHAPWNPSSPDNTIEDSLLIHLAGAGQRVYCAPERGDPSPLHSVIRWGTQETQEVRVPPPTPSQTAQIGNAVVAGEAGGRMGDQLLVYAHAKWVAYHYHLPLLFSYTYLLIVL